MPDWHGRTWALMASVNAGKPDSMNGVENYKGD